LVIFKSNNLRVGRKGWNTNLGQVLDSIIIQDIIFSL
jgi:hypothetical protein